VAAVAGCRGLSEALTAHVDVVARAGNEELSVTRLATLVGHSRAPLQKEFVRQLALLWVDYQLLGRAAAHGDSLNDPKVEDEALWPIFANARAKHWVDTLTKGWVGGDSALYAERYAKGDALAAWHILIAAPKGDTSAAKLDSVRRKAVALRATLTPENFADMAKKNSQDPGSQFRGGDLGVFNKGQMVPEFEQALLGLTPGQISAPVKTQFGYHLIYRPTYAQARDKVNKTLQQGTLQVAESLYVIKLDSAAKMKLTSNGMALTRTVAKDLDAHKTDQTAIATTTYGPVTAADFAKWLSIFPPAMRTQLPTAPDSVIPGFIRNIVRNETMLRQADSAHIVLDSAETSQIRGMFTSLIVRAWTQLGVDPKLLADSAKTPADRERLAAAHIESFLDRLLTPTPSVRLVDIPQPLENALREKYESEISETGLDRALSRATAIRRQSDSSRVAKEPPSAVPLPGGAMPGGPGAPRPGGPSAPKP
jgi:peptidyl-prolyl cis-trans isomerase D